MEHPRKNGRKKIASYVHLLSAEGDLIKNKNLTLVAAETIDLFRIPSKDVIEVLPKLAGELLYSDSVRQHFPNLAQLMKRRELFTIAAMEDKWSKIMSAGMKANLYKTLWSPEPDALRNQSEYVAMLAAVLRVSPDDILSPTVLNYAAPEFADKPKRIRQDQVAGMQ